MKANNFKNFSYAMVAAVATLTAANANAAIEIRVPGLNMQGQPSPSFAESFALYGEADFIPNAGCDTHTRLDLDQAQLNGKIAVLEEKVSGACEIFVNPNTRIYRLSREDAGCGSSLYKGTVATNDGINTIEILDHRARRCRDRVPARVIVTEKREGAETTLYSAALAPRPAAVTADAGNMTCMAYWEGFVRENGVCVQAGASGCRSPFEFETKEACEAAHQTH